jgi:two-component system, OmpR family, response regulator VicR
MAETKNKILIVEDEKSLAKILQHELDKNGFETGMAGNGKEALDMLAKNHFDLILLDLMMPVMSGFQVLDELSKNQDQTPVIVTTNLGQEEDKQKASAMGAKEYLVKTDTPIAELIQRVKNFLAEEKQQKSN